MKTLITDIHKDLIDLDPVKPFFYPLQREGQIRFITPDENVSRFSARNRESKIESMIQDACQKARLELRRNPPSAWQVIFLVNLENDPDPNSPFDGSLMQQLERIRNQFISVLEKGGVQKPERIFVICLDTLERDPDTFAPKATHQHQWELETYGYIASDEIPDESISAAVFTEAELDALNQCWQSDIGRELKYAKTDIGISGLHATENEKALGEKIRTCCTSVKDALSEQIARKKEGLNALQSPEIRQMVSDGLDQLQKGFSEELDNWMNTNIARFIEPAPVKALLKKHLWECFSATSPKYRDFICIRFSIKDWRGRDLNLIEYRRCLLRLAYLLIFLAEQGTSLFKSPSGYIHASNLTHTGFWLAESIEIDNEALHKILSEYDYILRVAKSKTSEQLKKPVYDKLNMVKNTCTCKGNDLPRTDTARTPPANHTQKEWLRWRDDVNVELSHFQDAANLMIDDCQIQLADPGIVEKEDHVPVEQKRNEFYQTRQQLWEELRETPFEKIAHNWQDAVKYINDGILDIFSCMPNWRQILILIFTSLVILIAPYMVDLWILKEQRSFEINEYLNLTYLLFPAIVLLSGGVIAFLIYHSYWSDLKEFFSEAFRNSRRIAEGIEKQIEINLRHIQKSCELCVAVRNQRNAEAVLKKVHDHRMLMVCHETKLENHLTFAENFLEGKREYVETPEYLRTEERIDYSQPAVNLPMYAPATYCHEETKFRFKMEMSTGEQELTSKVMPALRQITIIRDPAYIR